MISATHPFFPKFKELMREVALNKPVYDLGTHSRFFKEMGLVRDLFDPKAYKAGGYKPDLSQGEANCDLDCDLHNLSGIPDGAAGSVVCLSVLEHVLDPQQALKEIHRILRPQGLFVASVPFAYPHHGKSGREVANPLYHRNAEGWISDSSHEGYSDYWRYTHEGLAYLFMRAGFSRIDVYPIDGRLISRLQLCGLYDKLARIPLLRGLIHRLDKAKLGTLTTMHYVRAEK